LNSSQARRALIQLGKVRGLRAKFSYLKLRLFPSRTFMRTKYPRMQGMPLALLYLRRAAELVQKRPERSDN
jgi:hypothetical protein